ncbi:two-component system CitB family response regulator [Labedella gwakjiensis]|uniref:Transcriptional regulatory protein n=1 Tax=Labedella gwakjiensis TaxID=390269 RepID=A0A2P8GYF1_9MICO|nr:response regulator [Labedella gwakjiensis]PSL38996.1 two-component system CitB family response regulator [Labedella gwakjiensis]RUQ86550.1 response regulator [Labedella gwakjiensis]
MTGLTVAIVDDDFRVAGLHGDIVAATAGFEVVGTAGTRAEAERLIAGTHVDLVLADVYLPDGDGIDLVRRLDVDAIVLSAATDGDTVRRAFRSGAFGYLVKPFPDERLGDLLRGYTRYRNLLAAGADTDQDTIGRARRALVVADGSATSGGRAPTEAAVLEALTSSDADLSAPEVAARVGISRATAQRYLAALARDGSATVSLSYGSTGRPEHRFRAARPGSRWSRP